MPKLIDKQKIARIKFLRERGYSLPEIKRDVGVSQGSVFRHINGIRVLPQYKSIWFGKWKSSLKRKAQLEEEAKSKAKQLLRRLSNKDKILFLTALYWGEGNKKDFMFTNSDSDMIKIFLTSMRELYKVKESDIKISIRIYEDINKAECLKYWSQISGIPSSDFQGISILKGKKVGRLTYGMCRVRIKKGGNLLKYTQALRDRIINLF